MNMPGHEAPLSIRSLEEGLDFIAQIPLANPLVAERRLIRLLDGMLGDPPDPGVLLGVLEHARAPLSFVEEEMARRYHNKPLPLSDDEESCFQQVILAWRKMAKAYALCAQLEEPDPANAQYVSLLSLILHRCIHYSGMLILEHYRARRELPPGLWLDLHGYFETAEEWGVATQRVEDVLENGSQATHCAAAYVTVLLIELSSPYSNSVRNLNLIRRWAAMWAPLVSVRKPDAENGVSGYVVELMKDAPLHPRSGVAETGEDTRCMDTRRVGQQIEQMLRQLRQHQTPSQLGLGEETGAHVIALLEQLARPWALSTAQRRFRRFTSEGAARVAVGFDTMYFCVTGKDFIQPESGSPHSRGQFEELFTFGERAEQGQELLNKPHGNFVVDEWAVSNSSADGFRLARGRAGQRIVHGQAMVICPPDGEHFLLAQVTWLMQEDAEDGLVVGAATLPGIPAGIGVRPTVEGCSVADRFVPAFLLPGIQAMRLEGSIVLPSGMYRASGILEVFSGGEHTSHVRMVHVLQRGTDFDRISYELV